MNVRFAWCFLAGRLLAPAWADQCQAAGSASAASAQRRPSPPGAEVAIVTIADAVQADQDKSP